MVPGVAANNTHDTWSSQGYPKQAVAPVWTPLGVYDSTGASSAYKGAPGGAQASGMVEPSRGRSMRRTCSRVRRELITPAPDGTHTERVARDYLNFPLLCSSQLITAAAE